MIKTERFGIFILFIFAGFLSFGINFFSPAGIALTGQWDRNKGVVMAKSKQEIAHTVIEINNPLRVRQMIKNLEVVLMDVRPKEIYDMGHLPGAVSFPLTAFDEGLDTLLRRVKKDSVILVYCSGLDCTDSHTFAAQLMALNYKKVQVYAGGFREWQEMGYETQKMKANQLKPGWPTWSHWALRLVLGMTFIWASWPKMVAPGEFAKIIYGYGVFPGISINPIAIFLPYLEALAGVCLITGILPRSSLLILNGLLTAFIVLIGFNLFRGHVFDCGCFSVSAPHATASAWSLLIRDFFLLAAGICLWAQFRRRVGI